MDEDFLNAIEGVLTQQVESTRSSNVGSRPSAKSIYDQRKHYVQSLSKADYSFNHRVQHLITCELDHQRQSAQDCLKYLSLLHAEGKVWGQEMILQVQNEDLLLTDLESGDVLESLPLQNIGSCDTAVGSSPYNSLLVVSVQNQESTSILLFQSDEQPANALQRNLQKTLAQWKDIREKKDNIRNKVHNILINRRATTASEANERSYPTEAESPRPGGSGRATPQDSPTYHRRYDAAPLTFQSPSVPNQKADAGRDIEVLNHVLADIEIFVGKLNPEKKKKKKKEISSIPESQFTECLQKVKYSFNLLGKVKEQMSQPSAVELVHILMDILPKILSHCPGKNLAGSVLSPSLTQKAILLLSSCVTDRERKMWEGLGDAWLRTREDMPNGKSVAPYVPTFSDGWIPPAATSSSGQAEVQQSRKTPTINRQFQSVQMNVAYDFEARNERELSVKKGDRVTVLDKSRRWWMVENTQQQTGFVPNNVLEITTNNQQVRIRAVTLQPSSTTQDVTEWLQDNGFSRITVRCLGVLRGEQLLDLSLDDLKAVCPEEGSRVYSQISEIRASAGM